jgi:PmbA protein
MSTKMNHADDMAVVVARCIDMAKQAGAREAAARGYRDREVSLEYRDGKVEKISEATRRGVSIELFVDERYSAISTSDLRPDALRTFIADSIAVAKTLAPDPYRALPDPALYKDQAKLDLKLEDPKYAAVNAAASEQYSKAMYDAARSVRGNEAILSVTSGVGVTLGESWLMTSNGFSGTNRETSYAVYATVSAKDADGRRPEEYDYAMSRFWSTLPDPQAIGRKAAERTLARMGSQKSPSASMTVLVDNRAAGRLMNMLLQPLQGSALQQKRSFLENKLGETLFSPLLTLTDDPFIPSGFGSRLYDNEGIAAKPRTIFDKGTLKSYYIDTYYGRKLNVAPTSGSASNLAWQTGSKSQAQLLADVDDGLLVTGFIGGNANAGTGDFSLGVIGFRIRNGAIAEPVSEMNLSGNNLEFWKQLVAVGNDPFPYSSLRTPTLVFEGVSVAGV